MSTSLVVGIVIAAVICALAFICVVVFIYRHKKLKEDLLDKGQLSTSGAHKVS
jgi:uncharacterized protein YoxC